MRRDDRQYPTDFVPISAKNLPLLAKRGEQLTQAIIDRYLPQVKDCYSPHENFDGERQS
ncbi:hypothetical protein [Bradyrhizobium uaiense]|uniref:hypothetical protein n=1 Tax=Bradyrhizobium uaiense TaxID=2594946 RepID=UPI0013D6D2B0|nr:hypothetical protein [Bradyrhizobium uaiense]